MSNFGLEWFRSTHIIRSFEGITPEALVEVGLGDVSDS